MIYCEFKVVNQRFIKMSAEDRVKALEEIEAKARLQAQNNTWQEDQSSAFPGWLLRSLRDFSRQVKGEFQYDMENDVVRMKCEGGDRLDGDELYAKACAFLVDLQENKKRGIADWIFWRRKVSPKNRQAWFADNKLQISISFVAEADAIKEVDEYLGAKPKGGDNKAPEGSVAA